MRVGDLVRWTKPGSPDVGIVIRVLEDTPYLVHVLWTHPYEYSGLYPYDTRFLELVDKDEDKRNL